MRMWMVDPALMCDQHLLGEHVELHMLAGTLRQKKSITGFVDGGLIEVHNVIRRHEQLVREMSKRGMNHRSPLPKVRWYRAGKIDVHANVVEMARRCVECRRKQRSAGRP